MKMRKGGDNMTARSMAFRMDYINRQHEGCDIIHISYRKQVRITVSHFDVIIIYIVDKETGDQIDVQYKKTYNTKSLLID